MTETTQKANEQNSPKKARSKPFRLVLGVALVALIIASAYGIRYILWLNASEKCIDAVAKGEFPLAIKEGQKSLELIRILPDPQAYANNLRLLGTIYACRRQFDKAETYYKFLLSFDEKTWGRKSSHYAANLDDLALVYRKTGKFKDSEDLYKEAIETYKTVPNHELERARSLALCAWVLMKQKKLEEALNFIAESDQIFSAQLGQTSFERLVPLVEGAYISKQQGKTNQVYADINTAYKLITEPKPLEESNAQTVVAINLLAQMLDELGEKEKALTAYQLALKNCQTSAFGGEYNTFMCDILAPEARLLRAVGKTNEADKLDQQAKSIRALAEPN